MNKNKNRLIAIILSAFGTIFLIYYIFRASLDIVVSDYIRIINYYLEDVSDLKYLLSWECISRIPFTFLARFINVKLFNYSVNFDRILGLLGLFILNYVTISFVLKKIGNKVLKAIASVAVSYIVFSLMSWEMILNGTGYAHFITIGLASVVFSMLSDDTVGARTTSPHFKNQIAICILIIITSLIFGGSYSVSFLCTVIFFSVIKIIYNFTIWARKNERANSEIVGASPQYIYILISIICLLCYFKSNNTGEPLIPVGVKDITLIELVRTNPIFPIRFLLKSLASSIIGVETFDYAIIFGTIDEKIILLVGTIYLLIIVFVLVLIIKCLLSFKNKRVGASANGKTDISELPIIYIVYGLANYALVFLARYSFVRDEYGMSSRYSLQYMFLTLGVILVLFLTIDKVREGKNSQIVGSNSEIVGGNFMSPRVVGASTASPHKIALITICALSISFILLGHITTNTDEIFKADYRKIAYENLKEKAFKYKELSDEELENLFEYRRSTEHIKNALRILQEQHLNIYK